MEEILEIHRRFLKDTYEINKFGSNFVTCFPSLIFLFTNFLMVYKFCHRYTRLGFTTFRAWFFRELTFHWSFFYLSKIWFLFMKTYKYGSFYTCRKITYQNEFMNRRQCHLATFFLLLILSIMPFAIFIFKTAGAHRIPNFLLWVAEDRWVHHEIGIAGHYLDRPPRFSIPKRREYAYKTHRSSSAEETTQKGTFVRTSKSLQLSKCVKNVEELY